MEYGFYLVFQHFVPLHLFFYFILFFALEVLQVKRREQVDNDCSINNKNYSNRDEFHVRVYKDWRASRSIINGAYV